ncbi:MAG: glycosyltransferase family 2 protein [Patescibacteria group bacterium]
MHQRFFEILPGALAWTALIVLILFSWQLPVVVVFFIVIYDLYWFLKTLYLFFHLRVSFSLMKKNMKENWLARLEKEKKGDWEKLWHLIILPVYKEPYEVVERSLFDIEKSNYPKDRFLIVLATEARAGEEGVLVAKKAEEKFKDTFGAFLVTTHPADLPNEIPGKGSNETWAAKLVKEKIIDARGIPYEDIIVSVFDIDTRPGNEYFSILSHSFLSAKDPHHSSFQPIPLYTNNFYSVSPFARLIGFSSTFWQLMQQSRPEQLVTFSSHSMPFKALVEIGYWHLDVVSEDSRIFFQCMLHHKGNWHVVPLLYPIYMDSVSGNNFFEALKNLYKQQRRWAWGVENFPYVMGEFWRRKDIPKKVKRFWTLQIFDGFFSWSTSSFIIFLFGWLPNIIGGDIFQRTLYSYNLPRITGWLINLASVGIITSALLSVVFLPPKETKNWKYQKLLYLAQWFLMPFTFIIFGSIPALEAQTRLMLGGKFRLGFWLTPKKVDE